MGASVSLGREFLTGTTHCPYLAVVVVTQGADWAALPRSSVSPDVMGLFRLQSSEVVLQGHLHDAMQPAHQPSDTGHPPPGHTFYSQGCCLSTPGERSRHFLQPQVCTALFLQQLHLEDWPVLVDGVDVADSPSGAATFGLR